MREKTRFRVTDALRREKPEMCNRNGESINVTKGVVNGDLTRFGVKSRILNSLQL